MGSNFHLRKNHNKIIISIEFNMKVIISTSKPIHFVTENEL